MDITPNIIKFQVTFKKASQDYTKPKGYIYTASVPCRALQARVPTSVSLVKQNALVICRNPIYT
jgi:hypothetical protein